MSDAYVESLYEAWLLDHDAVSQAWQEKFAALDDSAHEGDSHSLMLSRMQQQFRSDGGRSHAVPESREQIEFPSRALYLINAYRMHGHLHATLDPLRLNPPKPSPELDLGFYGLDENDLDTEFPTGDLLGASQRPLRDILELLEQTYCGNIGPELMHMMDTAQRHWLQSRLEKQRSTPDYDVDTRRHIFNRIMRAEEFERFLHTRYAGQKRFSLEGGESLIPMLDTLVQRAGSNGVKEIILGMAHRGRLNVLANTLGKSMSEIFSEFEGSQFADADHGAGDVKYHMGFSSDIRTPGGTVHLSLGFNPSHLEIISPVVLGSVRARQCRRKDKARREVMAVLVHGDAAFAGQGVVAESLNLGQLSGFRTGGTIHIVVNNQIGFTTNPYDSRSTLYCTDIAKMVQAPILHVNGNDPEACCLAMELAVEYRHTFRSDIVLDLVCYRRHGHNEADAPEVTQPLMYRRIHSLPTVLQAHRNRLVKAGVIAQDEADKMAKDYREHLDEIRRDKDRPLPQQPNSLHGRWEGFVRDNAPEPNTPVDASVLADLVKRAHAVPADFSLHPKVEKIFDTRVQMMEGDRPIDWGCAEIMAYASLVNEGGWIRLSGQDSGRGTFFHRHAIVYDEKTGRSFVPLKQVENGELSHYIVVDSMLSEMAVMGFEYGYSVAEPRALVIWEAQYGDFANMAQVVIDQFISAGESKWKRMSGLVLWLPHGYEGQGAEHSSARLERYLQLCAEDNMQVVYPTTPAQLFHLLRRQSLINTRKPLIMMTPKSMLRQKLSFSNLEDFTQGAFQPILQEASQVVDDAKVRRLLLCSGKVYFDLLAERNKQDINDISMVRIERLYPFPGEELQAELAKFTNVSEVVWVQEEPLNQGAWYQIKHHLKRALLPKQRLHHICRQALAAPAVGSAYRHAEEQRNLVEAALNDKAFEDVVDTLPLSMN